MTSEAPSPREGWTVQVVACGICLVFAISTITYLVFHGSPTNSLHDSALSWSFTLIGVVLVGLGVAEAIPTFARKT